MNHPVTKILLSLGCAGTLATTASAQLRTSYTAGDFLVGFRQVGSTNSVVVDIGPINSFSSPLVFTINTGTTLSAQYGAGWASDSNVFSSLVETDSADNTSYVTSASYQTGINAGPAKIWSRLTNSNANLFQGKVATFGNEFTSAAAGNQNTNPTIPAYTGAGGEVEPAADPNAYANFMPGGAKDSGHATNGNIAWGYFNPTTEGNFDQTTTGVHLDLIKLAPGTGPGTDLGFFQVSGDGNTLTFTPAVPEPSSYAATVGLGVLALLGFRLNKARKSSAKEQSA